MKHASRWAILLVATAACTATPDDAVDQPIIDEVNELPNAQDEDPEDPAVVPGPTVTRSYSESSEDFLNPERGYYAGYDLRAAGDAGRVRRNGKSLAITLVRLDSYRHAPLDAALLADLEAGFEAARVGGIKVVLRFMYNAAMSEDASRARILGHIDQLTPLLRSNADVIAVMQAGFIGAWGEWHSSTNNLGNDADRTAILNAIVDAMPASRQVQVRTPMFKAAAYGSAPLSADEAYANTRKARVGHHNDCFLASASDLGTYASPVASWMSYVASDAKYTAIGGETCQVYTARTACSPAVAEMADKRFSYLNAEYNALVLAGWEAGGCAGDIKKRLGYRFVMDEVTHTQAVAPGGELALTLEIKNRGFAAPFNKRPVEIVLTSGATRIVARLDGVDARGWQPGITTSVAARLRIPATLAPGAYTLSLRLPDEAGSLADDSRYAIRMANQGMWDDANGDNVLTAALSIDPAAPGPRDPGARDFVELR